MGGKTEGVLDKIGALYKDCMFGDLTNKSKKQGELNFEVLPSSVSIGQERSEESERPR